MRLAFPADASRPLVAPISAVDATLMVTATARQSNYQEKSEMKLGGSISAALLMSALLIALPGCQKQEGPAEKAGKEIDKTMEKAGQQVEKAGDAVQDAAKGDKK
ncbi:MAG TPA: hypothetical protein PK752_10390 [Accumulibacter sp.]|uniref:hypothetical protein n=1 Tax=Accumulibacter sp. TaxID=2053492 RepID=UPI002C355FE3|nr:hypothetical protein [Accumulibacter sp.]HRD88643.1 hypothetical protein [Accumulibacter sp.]